MTILLCSSCLGDRGNLCKRQLFSLVKRTNCLYNLGTLTTLVCLTHRMPISSYDQDILKLQQFAMKAICEFNNIRRHTFI